MAPISSQNPDSSALFNSGLWATVAGLHPAQILRSHHLITLEILPADVKLMFSKKIFFRSGYFLAMRPLGGKPYRQPVVAVNVLAAQKKTTF